MITYKMKPEEVLDEVLLDYEEVFRFSDTKDNAFRKRVQKASVFPVRAYADYVSKRRNKWLVLFEARSKKHTGDNALLHLVCYANMQGGYYAYFPIFNNGRIVQLLVFPPHFFQRYAERAEVDKTGVQLIRHYFERNYSYFLDSEIKNSEIDENAIKDTDIYIQGITEQGIALGNILGIGIIILKTFIAWDDTFEDQHKRFFPMTTVIAEVKREEDELVRSGFYNR